MLKMFSACNGLSVAINPSLVAMVSDYSDKNTPMYNYTRITFADSTFIDINESYLSVVARLNERD